MLGPTRINAMILRGVPPAFGLILWAPKYLVGAQSLAEAAQAVAAFVVLDAPVSQLRIGAGCGERSRAIALPTG
jgi:hypothetical protein